MTARALKPLLMRSVSALVLTSIPALALAQSVDEDAGDYLGEVILETGKREVQTQTAVPVTTINQEEIDDRQAATVAQLIDSVPGVTLVNGTTPQSSGINIRGFGANGTYGSSPRVLITIDGATTGGEEIYRIGNQLFTDPALYKHVSVIRGTVGSFEYGSGAVGGVVQLETKDASDFTGGEIGLRLRQMVEAQSNGTGFATSTILAWQPTENFEFLTSYTLRDADPFDSGDGTESTVAGFRNDTVLLKGRYTFGDDQQHAISGWYNSTHSEDNGVPYDILGLSFGFYFGDVDRVVDSRTAGLRYEFNPIGNDLIDFSATLTYAQQEIDSTYIPGSCAGFDGCDARVSDLLNADHDYETTKLTLKNNSYFTTGAASHDLRFGLEYINRERLDANSAPGGSDDRWAIFAVDDIQIGNALTLTPALRYESQRVRGTDIISPGATDPFNGSFNNSALTGGFSARYEFDSGFAAFASAAYTEVNPIIDRLDKDPSVWVPEKGRTYEAGFSYNGSDLFSDGDQFAFKANVYQTNLRDVRVPGDILTTVEVEGVEIEAGYGHQSGFYMDLNATFADGDQYNPVANTTTDWALAPEPTASLTLGKRFGDTWDLSWELVAAKGAEALNGTGELGGYGISNLRATYTVPQGALKGTEVRLGIENAFDKQFQTQLSSRPAAGRNVKLSLAKTF